MFSDVLYNQRITNQLKHFHNPPPSPHTPPCHYNHLPHPSLCSRHHLVSLHCHHHRLFSSSHHLTAIGQYQHLLPSHSNHHLSQHCRGHTSQLTPPPKQKSSQHHHYHIQHCLPTFCGFLGFNLWPFWIEKGKGGGGGGENRVELAGN